MRNCISFTLCVSLICSTAMAQMGRRGGGQRVNVQNRSVPQRQNNYNHNNNMNVNRNANINQNVNVNRNVNVNVNNNYHGGGCYNCGGYYHDNDWNWGSFAAGAAVGVATTAVVAAATRPSTTVVVAAPAIGTMVPVLPGGCAAINTGGTVMYNCSNVYYRPYYQGTALVYQVVTYP
jgi:hypothetical protein